MENELKENKPVVNYKTQIGKQMSLASLDYPKFSKEIKKLIKSQKLYKDAIDTIQMYTEKQRPKLTVVEKIILNRKLAYCCNKLLKLQVIDSGEFDKHVMQSLMEKCQRSIFEGYRFINIYITKVMDNRLNQAIFSDASYLTSEDEYQSYHLSKQKNPKIDEINSQYKFDKKLLRQKKLNYKNQIDYEQYDIFKVQSMIENQLNENLQKPQIDIGYELTQYFLNLVKQMLNLSYLYKNQRLTPPKYKIAFFYLVEADRIMSKIIFSADPDILLLAAKVKIALGSFYFEAGKSEEALSIIEEAILICQFEIHLNQVLKGMKKTQKSVQEKKDMFGIKLLLVALNIYGIITQDLKQYQRMYEVMMLADFVSQKIKKLDDLAKYTEKQVQIAENYRKYLQEEAELTWIAEVHLGVDLAVIVEREKKELLKNNNESFKNYFIQSQLKLYKKFRNRDIAKHKLYTIDPLKEKFTQNWHIENLKKSQTPNVQFTLEKKGNPLEEADKLLKIKNQKQFQNLNDELQGYESDEDAKFKNPLLQQQKIQQKSQQEKFQKIKNQSMQSMYSTSQNQNSMQKKQQSQSQFRDSNIDKNTQLSNSGSISDSGFFNESFFAPSSDHEDDWKSSIHNSVKQSFIYRQKSAKNSHRQSFVDFQKQDNTLTHTLNPTSGTQNQTKKSTLLIDAFQTQSQIQLQNKINDSNRPKTTKAKKQEVQINYPQVKYKPQLQIQKYNKPGTHPKEPKVLTTNEYFQNRQNTSRKRINSQDERERLKNPAIRNEIKFKRIKHNIERQEDWDYEGLDSQIQSYVDENIKDKNNFRNFNVVSQHVDQFHKMDDFDKNEFHYCRKMLHQKMLEGLKIQTPQINHSDKPNNITMKGIVQKDIRYLGKKQYFQEDMEVVYEKKNQAKVDRIYAKQLNIQLGQDEQELMKRKLQANQKKNLQLLIFKYRENKLFYQAKHLKELYKKYEEALQQKQRQERRLKEQAEREKENQLIMKKVKEKEVEQENQHQQQQQQQVKKKDSIEINSFKNIVDMTNEQNTNQNFSQRQINVVRFDQKNLEEEQQKDKKSIIDLKNKSKKTLNTSTHKDFQIKKTKLKNSQSENSIHESLKKDWLVQKSIHDTSGVIKNKKQKHSHTLFGNVKINNYKENLKGLSEYEQRELLEKIDKVTQKTQNVNKIISTDVDNEKWRNVELLKLSRIKLGKEKSQKEEQYDFNKGLDSQFKDLRMSILGMSQKTQFKEHKFYTFAEIASAKIRNNRQRNLIMGQNQQTQAKETDI